MLNENHAFILDFPELKLDIVQLNHDDPKFKADLQQYHQLDYDIRELEIAGNPIDDESMHALKLTYGTKRHIAQAINHASRASNTLN